MFNKTFSGNFERRFNSCSRSNSPSGSEEGRGSSRSDSCDWRRAARSSK